MKKLLFVLLIPVLSTFAFTQASSPRVLQPTTAPMALAREPFGPDTILMAELLGSIDARKAKAGDAIKGRLRGDTWGATQNLLPDGSILIGHVIEAHGKTKELPESKLAVCFDKARLKDGTEIPLNLLIDHFETPPNVVLVRSSGDDGLASLNKSMARAAGPTTSNNSKVGSYDSRPVRSPVWEKDISGARPGLSGLRDVELTKNQQDSGSFAVLTSSRHTVKVSKHDLVYLRIVQENKEGAK